VAPSQTQEIARGHIAAGETVLVVLVGASKQALVALEDRLIIIKPGMMAGASFGARVTTFPYRDIVALEVNTGMRNGVVEVIAAGYQGTKGVKYWSSEPDTDPFQISNCLPAAKKAIASWQPKLESIRESIHAAKSGPPPGTPPPPGLDREQPMVAQLAQLAELHRTGALTDESLPRPRPASSLELERRPPAG